MLRSVVLQPGSELDLFWIICQEEFNGIMELSKQALAQSSGQVLKYELKLVREVARGVGDLQLVYRTTLAPNTPPS